MTDRTSSAGVDPFALSSLAGLGEGAISQEEHASNVLGLRRTSLIGLGAWSAFGIVDWFVVEVIEPGRLWLYLSARAVGLLIIAACAVRVHLKPMPSPRLARIMDVVAFVSASALVSVTCIEFRGIASPLALGIMTILSVRTATIPDKWQRGLLPIGLTAAVHPVVLLTMTLFSPTMAAQLGQAEQLGTFLLNQVFVFGAAAITLAGGHTVWALRRKVYEARSLGRYRLKRRIGQGGMGEVWAAHHNTLGREVAVKILRPDKMDESAVARFQREVQATSNLTHPNTVRVFDFGVTEDGLCYYAMELLSGEDLATIVKRDGPFDVVRAVRVIQQAARALAEAHEQGIVHRDIKPENIIVTSAGVDRDLVKVLDFGLARLVEIDGISEDLTTTGCIVGTPLYVAPEVVLGQMADPRADVYALGAVLYRLLTGTSPFDGEDLKAILASRVVEDPPPPSSRASQLIPPELDALVLRSMARLPDERFPTAGELADDLARLEASLCVDDDVPTIHSPLSTFTGPGAAEDADDPDTLIDHLPRGR